MMSGFVEDYATLSQNRSISGGPVLIRQKRKFQC